MEEFKTYFKLSDEEFLNEGLNFLKRLDLNDREYNSFKKEILSIREDYVSIKKILNTLDDGVYITDGEANTIFVNKSYERLSGTSKKLFLGKNMKQVVEEGLIDSSATCYVLENNKEISMNQVLNNKNEVLITSTPIYSSSGKINMVVTTVRDITQLNKLKQEVDYNKKDIDRLKFIINEESSVIYRSNKMKQILNRAKKVSFYDTSVLITGETGVGKDLIAKYIHDVGSRKEEKFMEINCSAIPQTLMESELFGYEPGAFTGALKKGKKGIFELANKGTIFLDEIGELPIELQAKLLKVIQNKEIRKIGGSEDIKIDVRIITATNRNLQEMVREGEFREDLYYRLNVIPIVIPPLRDRSEDILPLLLHFIEQNNLLYNEEKKFSSKAITTLYKYTWPGNVRELKNLVERVFILSKGSEIQKEELPKKVFSKVNYENNIDSNIRSGESLTKLVEDYEKAILIDAIEKTKTYKEAAILLSITPSTFTGKVQRYNI